MNNWMNRNIAATLAILIEVLGFVYLFWGPDKDRAAVIALMMMAPTFYYGSSPGSAKKDDLIAKMKTPESQPPQGAQGPVG